MDNLSLPLNNFLNQIEKELIKEINKLTRKQRRQEVQKQLSLLNPSVIMKNIEIIENKYKYIFPENYKEKFLNIYTAHYEKLKEITKNYHL